MAAVTAAAVGARRVRRLEVTGPSMLPTLAPGERLLAVRTGIGLRRLRPGDLAVFADPREPSRLVVKRVVEVAGESVTVRGDNAGASTDSRQFGPVRSDEIWGRAVYRYHPPGQRGRVGRLVP